MFAEELASIIETFVTELLDVIFGFLNGLFGSLSDLFGSVDGEES